MDDRLEQLIEMECADALLDGGVSVPLKRCRIPFKKCPLELRVTMKRPRLRGQILLAREYLKLGVAPGWKVKNKAEEMAFIAKHGKGISRMLAYTVCRGYVVRHMGIGLTARFFLLQFFRLLWCKKFRNKLFLKFCFLSTCQLTHSHF